MTLAYALAVSAALCVTTKGDKKHESVAATATEAAMPKRKTRAENDPAEIAHGTAAETVTVAEMATIAEMEAGAEDHLGEEDLWRRGIRQEITRRGVEQLRGLEKRDDILGKETETGRVQRIYSDLPSMCLFSLI